MGNGRGGALGRGTFRVVYDVSGNGSMVVLGTEVDFAGDALGTNVFGKEDKIEARAVVDEHGEG